MGVLSGPEPEAVFKYFEKICSIPHGSGNEGRLSDYIKDFAAKRGLFCIQDEWKNIIIIKEAQLGRDGLEPIILQGHMDMVAVREADCTLDMEKDGLRLVKSGDWISAEKTSLGGDDGIAAAYALALLDAKDIPHPRLEIILTTGEETGMEGAGKIDLSMLKGRRMINLDSEEEGVFLVSCAGGVRADCILPVNWEKRRAATIEFDVFGLNGGHSGTEIVKGGGNANCIMGRVLDTLIRETSAALISLNGGSADNAISILCSAAVAVEPEEAYKCLDIIYREAEKIGKEFELKDEGLRIMGEEREDKDKNVTCLTAESTKNVANYILAMPNGVQAMSAAIDGMVETSLNLGIMKLTDDSLQLGYAVRSSMDSAKEALIRRLEAVSALAGAKVEISGNYPGWAYRKTSHLRRHMISTYKNMYGETPTVQAIHAGLECGIIADKIPGLDCVSIGPNIENAHTTQERMSISSVRRVWEYLLKFIEW